MNIIEKIFGKAGYVPKATLNIVVEENKKLRDDNAKLELILKDTDPESLAGFNNRCIKLEGKVYQAQKFLERKINELRQEFGCGQDIVEILQNSAEKRVYGILHQNIFNEASRITNDYFKDVDYVKKEKLETYILGAVARSHQLIFDKRKETLPKNFTIIDTCYLIHKKIIPVSDGWIIIPEKVLMQMKRSDDFKCRKFQTRKKQLEDIIINTHAIIPSDSHLFKLTDYTGFNETDDADREIYGITRFLIGNKKVTERRSEHGTLILQHKDILIRILSTDNKLTDCIRHSNLQPTISDTRYLQTSQEKLV